MGDAPDRALCCDFTGNRRAERGRVRGNAPRGLQALPGEELLRGQREIEGASGTAGYFRLHDNGGTTCHMQGTITATGAGGDMQLDNTNIAVGQQITITAFTITAGGA